MPESSVQGWQSSGYCKPFLAPKFHIPVTGFLHPCRNDEFLASCDCPGPAGTYYYERAEHKVQFWHMFDQVLLRPDMISVFKNDELRILETDGLESFLNNSGIPESRKFSDHLPVLFSLDI